MQHLRPGLMRLSGKEREGGVAESVDFNVGFMYAFAFLVTPKSVQFGVLLLFITFNIQRNLDHLIIDNVKFIIRFPIDKWINCHFFGQAFFVTNNIITQI